ncbi:MAG: ANTAR domain-containing protein [Mycobacterium sp.]
MVYDDNNSRRVIDIAIGVLVALQGHSEREAFEELVAAVRRTGVGVGALAAALVALVGGRPGPTAHQAEALDVWGDLLASRLLPPAVRAT